MTNRDIINKTMDYGDLLTPESSFLINEINGLIKNAQSKGVKISSWYGKFGLSGDVKSWERINRGYNYLLADWNVDDNNFPWFLYWEIIWILLNNEIRDDQRILDLGGSSSLFSFYLASKGLDVTTLDLNKELVDNANCVAKSQGWNLKNYVMDMRAVTFKIKFHHITSICVYEHIPMYDRLSINKKIKELLVEEGKFSITFDYKNPSLRARINSPDDVYDQFIGPSGLKIRGNELFYDNGKRYLLSPFYYNKPTSRVLLSKAKSVFKRHFSVKDIFKTKDANDYTFAALFLENG
jgi:2-polyprenyl-3-methyl-5-hydroxy-6-metoxy-1,4-benzoquinol methylase